MRITRFIVAGLAALFLLSGCMPLMQYNHWNEDNKWKGGFGPSQRGKGLLFPGPSKGPEAVVLVDAESYAVGPRGKRYGIESEPHAWDLRENNQFDPNHEHTRQDIYLIKENGKRLSSWRNGDWQFTFVIDTPEGKISQRVFVKIWTFWYSPLAHGPPL